MVLWDWADRVVWNSNKYSPLRNRKDTAPYWPFIFKESEGIQVQAPLVWSVNSKSCLLFLRCHVGIPCWIGALWPLISGGSTTPLGKSSGKQGFKIFLWILVFIYGIIDNKRIFFFASNFVVCSKFIKVIKFLKFASPIIELKKNCWIKNKKVIISVLIQW